ncbi:MAG: hypothetical protein A2X56_11845 [Nitrospirae bacterium GWC2_57_13]|nr:MAG: hypothetical protein A2X56_11845 [Nitrospirae bacterium GWC2_57_13]HAS54854.1 signal peptide peptidase SppA [Nitrospiraceae bacterium]
MKKNSVIMVFMTVIALGVAFFIVLSLASFLIRGKALSPMKPLPGLDRIALVKVEGVLISSERIVDEVKNYTEDSSIKAIVVRVDSPGGAVVPAQEIYEALKNARTEGKKVVVSMGSVAASGGYYIAAAADRIVANPGTLTGSIGVKMEFANLERLLEKIGVKGMVLKAGKYKDVGSPYREMTAQEKELLQNVIDDVHSQFIEAVAEGRNIPLQDIRAIADGRIFTGRQAYELKLVDQLGDLSASIQAAADLAGIKGKPRMVSRERKTQFFDYLKQETASWIADVLSDAMGRNHTRLQYLYQ